jgi:hypothetical protein
MLRPLTLRPAPAGTREALAEQLRLGQELRRRVERPASGSDASTSASDASGDEGGEAGEGGEVEAGSSEVGGEGAVAKRGRGAGARAKAAALDLLHGAHRVWPPLCRAFRVGGVLFGCARMPEGLRRTAYAHTVQERDMRHRGPHTEAAHERALWVTPPVTTGPK